MASAVKRIEEAIMPTIDRLGYELVDVEIGRENGEKVLFIYIYHENGIGLDDCEAVSKAIDPIIEELDPIEGSYILCVSSPGLERPLKKPRDFERNVGREVVLNLYKAINSVKKFEGVLVGYDQPGKSIEVDIDGEVNTFLLSDISKIKPLIRFDDYSEV